MARTRRRKVQTKVATSRTKRRTSAEGSDVPSQITFFMLPAEIRCLIYKHLVAKISDISVEVEAILKTRTRSTPPPIIWRESYSCVAAQIIFVNRKIYDEALPVIASLITLYFDFGYANLRAVRDVPRFEAERLLPDHMLMHIKKVECSIPWALPARVQGRFMNLAPFQSLEKLILVWKEVLEADELPGPRDWLTPEEYVRLDERQKLEAWAESGRFGYDNHREAAEAWGIPWMQGLETPKQLPFICASIEDEGTGSRTSAETEVVFVNCGLPKSCEISLELEYRLVLPRRRGHTEEVLDTCHARIRGRVMPCP